MQFPVIQES